MALAEIQVRSICRLAVKVLMNCRKWQLKSGLWRQKFQKKVYYCNIQNIVSGEKYGTEWLGTYADVEIKNMPINVIFSGHPYFLVQIDGSLLILLMVSSVLK